MGSNKNRWSHRTQLLDLSLSKAIFIANRAPSPLHAMGTAEVNWVLILNENCRVTDQHNCQKVASKGGTKVGLDSWWAMKVKASLQGRQNSKGGGPKFEQIFFMKIQISIYLLQKKMHKIIILLVAHQIIKII